MESKVKEIEEKYIDLCMQSEKVVREYKNITDGPVPRELPHIANFSKEDIVISVMGINPSLPKNMRGENKQDDDIFTEKNQLRKMLNEGLGLDLYYIHQCSKELEDEINEWNDNNPKKQIILPDFPKKQYSLLKENVFNELNMSWQKYDSSFIDRFYSKDEYQYNLIKKLIDNYPPEGNKYMIFTNLLYVSDEIQRNIENTIKNSHYKDLQQAIIKLFEMQLNFYNAKLTIIANSQASHFFEDYISKNGWQKIDKLSPNLYKQNENNRYVYLISRFFDRKDIYFKNLFFSNLKFVVDQIL